MLTMARLGCNATTCRRYLLVTVLSVALAYPVVLVLMSGGQAKRAIASMASEAERQWESRAAPGNVRHLASRFDLQYLADAAGKAAETDGTQVGDNLAIAMHYGQSDYGSRPGGLLEAGSVRDRAVNAPPRNFRFEGTSAAPAEPVERSQASLKIPRTIHQTWENLIIPGQNADCVESWKKQHPSWQYWFWTEAGASLMIHRNFSQLADVYTDYPYSINRADARRYFIMYRYGGVYADLDVESLRPLDELLRNYSCIIAQEPLEHQVLVYRNKHPNYVMPAFIACRPRHPFFKMVLDALPKHAHKAKSLDWNDNIFQSTGPMFLGKILDEYLKVGNRTAEEHVHLAPPHWFMPTYDSLNEMSFRNRCSNETELTALGVKDICDRLKAIGFSNVPSKDSYTNHHWVHSWSSAFLARGHVTVTDVLRRFSFRIIDGK